MVPKHLHMPVAVLHPVKALPRAHTCPDHAYGSQAHTILAALRAQALQYSTVMQSELATPEVPAGFSRSGHVLRPFNLLSAKYMCKLMPRL